MAKTKSEPLTSPKGTLQRALADAAARTTAGEAVDSLDLNGGRASTQAAPYLVVTPELRDRRGWQPREPIEVTYRAAHPRPPRSPDSTRDSTSSTG